MTSCRLAVDDSNEDLPLRLFSNGKRFFFFCPLGRMASCRFFPRGERKMRREALYGRCFFSLAFHEKRHSFPFSGCKDVLCSTSVPLSFSSRGQPRCCVLVRQRTIHAVHPSSLQSNDQPRRPRSRFLAGGVLLLQQRVSILNSEVVQPLKKRVCYVLFYSYFTFFCSSPSTSPPLSSGSFFFFQPFFCTLYCSRY